MLECISELRDGLLVIKWEATVFPSTFISVIVISLDRFPVSSFGLVINSNRVLGTKLWRLGSAEDPFLAGLKLSERCIEVMDVLDLALLKVDLH